MAYSSEQQKLVSVNYGLKAIFWFCFWVFKIPEALFVLNDTMLATGSKCESWYPIFVEVVLGLLFSFELLIISNIYGTLMFAF